MQTPNDPPGETNPLATETLDQCVACDHAELEFHLWGKSRYKPFWYRYMRCPNCSLVMVNPRVPPGIEEETVESIPWAPKFNARKAPFDRREYGFNIVGPVRKLCPAKRDDGSARRWLDVGCAVGNLLDCVQRAGYSPEGLELNQPMVDWVREHRPEIKITQGLFGDLPDGEKWDIISADNVFEHVHRPVEFLKEARSRLTPDGLLVLRVPNYNTVFRKLFEMTGKLPTSYITDPDAHPWNYSRRPLEFLLAQAGFEPMQTMEHCMASYPLKHLLSKKTANWSAGSREKVARLFPATFVFDRLIPKGGIDITLISRKGDDRQP